MFAGNSKQLTAITSYIERFTGESYEEDDVSGVVDLIEVIRIVDGGPTEAARAIRKKLKYGSPHRKIRGLVILDCLIQNAGSRFQQQFADERLLDRLQLLARDDITEARVRQKCRVLYVQWANEYKNKPGLERIANLYKYLPKTHRPAAAHQRVLQDTAVAEPLSPSSPKSPAKERPASRPVTLTPTSSNFGSNKKLKGKGTNSSDKSFNLEKEKEKITNTLAKASMAATNLLNGLQLVNRESERVSDNPEIISRFETCKELRRQILYYTQRVESDDWIGSLVNANDELVRALTAYDIMDRSISDDSDSDVGEGRGKGKAAGNQPGSSVQQHLAGLSLSPGQPPARPPRPAPASVPMPPPPKFDEDEEDEDNPFADTNAVATPYNERSEPTWK